jgi:hypothetical protein
VLAKHPSKSLKTTRFNLYLAGPALFDLNVDSQDLAFAACARKAKRLCCGPGHHKASHSFFELPIRLVRNNHHVWQQLIPIQITLVML